MYKNLLVEAEYIQNAWGYNLLDAIAYIANKEEQYPSEVRRELKEFMFAGAKMFAPVED